MNPFRYTRARDVEDAVAAMAADPHAKYLGAGTNLLDLMKMGVEHPAHLIDVTRLPLADITEHAGGVRIGAMARNTDVANHPLIRRRYPMLSRALLTGASGQLRNMATVGGNLLQRTRCAYFYDPTMGACNKRTPGSGCAALAGINRMHAILGGSEHCIAVHPSDMCVALAALGAMVQVTGAKGSRAIAFGEFHRLPGDAPQIDTTLQPDELVTAVDVPALPFAARSTYLKVRDRNSYAFALVSVASALDLDRGGRIRDARIALGGVAHKPWRVEAAERAMVGQMPGDAGYRAAADLLLRGASPRRDNAFKVELATRAIVRSLSTTAALKV
jgi:xanthine dehydrogenase YagS FAD-binding subunit